MGEDRMRILVFFYLPFSFVMGNYVCVSNSGQWSRPEEAPQVLLSYLIGTGECGGNPPLAFTPECWNGVLPHPCQHPRVFDKIAKEACLTRQPTNPDACPFVGYIMRKRMCAKAPYKGVLPSITLDCGPPLFWGWEQVTLASQLKPGWKGTCIVRVNPVEFGVTIRKPQRTKSTRRRAKRSYPDKGMPHPLTSRMQYNLWVQLAKAANVTDFCLAESYDMENLISTCLIPVCVPASVMKAYSHTGRLHHMSEDQIKYDSLSAWGHASYQLPLDALVLHTPIVAVPEGVACAKITGCEQSTAQPKPLCINVSQDKLNCSSFQSVRSNYGHVWLPNGWFFTCGKETFNYIPANLSTAYCCLSRLTAFLPSRSAFTVSNTTRYRRADTLSEDCDSTCTLLNPAEYNALAISLVGVPALALRAHININSVACSLAKTINATSVALSAINQELIELRKAILQNRAAIDYLLLHQHLGCDSFEGMCCFNLTDQSEMVKQQIKVLHKVASDLQINTLGSWWNNLWSWLPMGLIGTIVQYIVILIAVLIGGCCLVQCLFSLVNNVSLPKRMSLLAERKATAQVMAMWDYENMKTADPSVTG